MTPPEMTDAQIAAIVRDASKNSIINRDGSTSQRIAKAIIAARDKQWADLIGKPVAYLAWRDGKPCYEGEDAVCEDAVWPVDGDDDRTSMPVYAPKQEKPE